MSFVVGQSRPRCRLFLALLLALVTLASLDGLTPPAAAQDDEGERAAEAPKQSATSHSLGAVLKHIITSVGLVFGAILLLISIALVTLVVLLVMELRMDSAVPPSFVEEFTDTVNKRRFKEAYEMAKEDPSFVARVLTAGMSRLQYGIEDAREASFSMLESVKAGKEQLIVYLATIGTLGPLIGLVGTVYGMILAFMTLSSSATGINAQQLAGEISHALVVTLLGIGLSVPAIFAHAFFKNRLVRLTHDAGTVADDLLTQMYYNSKKAGAVPEPAAEPARAAVPPIPPAIKQK
jgi:biopolymer transport protein ExbB